MKIFIYGIGKKEQPVAEQWANEHGIDIAFTDQELNTQTVHLAKGADGISFQQMTAVHDEEIYQVMAENNIHLLSTRSAGIDGLSMNYLKKYHINACNVPVYSPRAIAEHALTLTMMLLRQIPRLLQREQQQDFTLDGLIGREIHELTVGVIGTGHIGLVTAELFKALGATVIAYDKYPKKDIESILTYRASLEDVAQEADILTLHTPYFPENHHLINEAILKRMKPDALLINTARGPLVDTQALIQALKTGEIAGAGLDTLEDEMLFVNKTRAEQKELNPYIEGLLALDTVVVSPHIAFYTLQASKILMESSLNSLYTLYTTGTSEALIQV
jgi:D-lactate dehydrogenase